LAALYRSGASCVQPDEGVVMKARRAVAIALLVIAAGAMIQPATAAPIKWLAVHLGTHRFGQLSRPDAIVARAGAHDVGFECGKPSACAPEGTPTGGCGCIDTLPQGPTSFDVGRDGSIWLLDGVKHRLLVWQRGRSARPVRSVRLPSDVGDSDFALGRDGTVYVFAGNVPHRPYLAMYALTRSGGIRWKAATTVGSSQARLVSGPDGSIYAVGPSAAPTWTPLTTPAGRPLPLAVQRRRSSPLQPLAEDRRLLTTQVSDHQVHFALIDRTHRVVRAWRVTSATALAVVHATPALIGGDLVVPLDVSHQASKNTFRWEHLILRLGPTGGTRQRLTLDARAVWDPDGTTTRTTLRIGADGRVYQLRTDPKTGVSVARYSLGRT
jgi:hypothetical protein